jgi:hypothetical protein
MNTSSPMIECHLLLEDEYYTCIYLIYFEMYIHYVLLMATLYIVILHGYTLYLIRSHDLFHPEHGYACLRETIIILQMAPLEI